MALKLKGSTSGFVALDSPAVAGNNTITLPDSNGSANQVWANDNTAGVTTYTQVTINRNGDITTPGTLSIGGTVTYEDVTNVDSVGLITARSGIVVSAGVVTVTDGYIDVSDSSRNTRIGSNAGDSFSGTTTDNTLIGYDAGTAITSGDNNTGLDKINQIQVRNFEYRTKEEITDFDNPDAVMCDKTGTQLGVIAQEIQELEQMLVIVLVEQQQIIH